MSLLINYFCYGSNMLTKRMQLGNKSASKLANGILSDYKLSFSGNSLVWKGATANIVPQTNHYVHGVVYTLDQADISNLDRQETGYNAIDVEVELITSSDCKKVVSCRTYIQKDSYKLIGNPVPSKLYKDVIIKGAEEHQLLSEYVDNVIKAFPDNGIVQCGPTGFLL